MGLEKNGSELDEYNRIALFTVSFSHLHYNVLSNVGCEAISG